VVNQDASELIILRNQEGGVAGGLVAMLSEENGQRVGWIYDVLVDDKEIGKNQGEILLNYGIDWLSLRGAGTVVFDPKPNFGLRHRCFESRSFDETDTRLIVLGLSKAVEYSDPKYPHAVD
jgi:hypothetical protein